MMMLCGFLPALNIVGEKEKGTIEQINVTPVSKWSFILAKLIPYWIIGLLVLTVCLVLSWLVYGITCQGPLLWSICWPFCWLCSSRRSGLSFPTIATPCSRPCSSCGSLWCASCCFQGSSPLCALCPTGPISPPTSIPCTTLPMPSAPSLCVAARSKPLPIRCSPSQPSPHSWVYGPFRATRRIVDICCFLPT